MNESEMIGYGFMKGATMWLAKVLVIGFIILLIYQFTHNLFSIGVDSSDFSSWNRSGLKIYTDAKTGIEYLSTRNGTLTPRIDANGQILTNRQGLE